MAQKNVSKTKVIPPQPKREFLFNKLLVCNVQYDVNGTWHFNTILAGPHWLSLGSRVSLAQNTVVVSLVELVGFICKVADLACQF
mgnify:CR=1 FL=1